MQHQEWDPIARGSTPVVWTVAGSDSSGSAGIEADIKTLEALGCHAATVITAVTAQGLKEAWSSMPIKSDMLHQIFRALSHELPPAVIKIGMLATKDQVTAVAEWIKTLNVPTVYDPVLETSSGLALATEDTVEAIKRDLLPAVDMVTPNLIEAGRLTGSAVETEDDMLRAGDHLMSMGPSCVVMKGGHGHGPMAWDTFMDQRRSFWLGSPRHPWNVRGTGCAMASSIAAHRAHGLTWSESVVLAKAYMIQGIARSRSTSREGLRLFRHQPLHLDTQTCPLVSRTPRPDGTRPPFPSIGSEPLGFYPIFDRSAWIPKLAALGVTTMQLRIKDLTGEELIAEIHRGILLGRQYGVRLFINDHWQSALQWGAYGVHLGQEDLLSADLTTFLKSGLRLGISTHSYEEAAAALCLSPSYIALGPIFETTCKSMNFGPHGLEKIATWARLSPVPVVAIGGLTPEHAAQARANGASGVAAISDWITAQDPLERVQMWLKRWQDV